jgi:hypothetical protein
MGRVGMGSLLALAAGVALAGCAARYGTLALGQYELFSPFADLARGRREVELSRPGYVAVLDIAPLDPAYRAPQNYQTFRPIFPLTVHDSTRFPAGAHVLRYFPVTETMRVLCSDADVPSIDGCRASRDGPTTTVRGSVPASTHYLVVVAESYIDPYTLAYHLDERLLVSDTFAGALHRRDTEAVDREITLAIAEAPDLGGWAAFYAVRTN